MFAAPLINFHLGKTATFTVDLSFSTVDVWPQGIGPSILKIGWDLIDMKVSKGLPLENAFKQNWL